MSTYKIDEEEAFQALRDVVKQFGADYRYREPGSYDRACMYSEADGQPSCLVGHVLARVAPDLFATIHEQEHGRGYEEEVGSFPILHLTDRFDVDVTDDTLTTLEAVQYAQDSGRTWGEALTRANITLDGPKKVIA